MLSTLTMCYLYITCPDIAYVVGQLAMYMGCHGPAHHKATRYLLQYLKAKVEVNGVALQHYWGMITYAHKKQLLET